MTVAYFSSPYDNIHRIIDYQTYFVKLHTVYRTFSLFYEWDIEEIMANQHKFSYTSAL